MQPQRESNVHPQSARQPLAYAATQGINIMNINNLMDIFTDKHGHLKDTHCVPSQHILKSPTGRAAILN